VPSRLESSRHGLVRKKTLRPHKLSSSSALEPTDSPPSVNTRVEVERPAPCTSKTTFTEQPERLEKVMKKIKIHCREGFELRIIYYVLLLKSFLTTSYILSSSYIISNTSFLFLSFQFSVSRPDWLSNLDTHLLGTTN
jgi:hypothetical protein